jgi:hypothetical protein
VVLFAGFSEREVKERTEWVSLGARLNIVKGWLMLYFLIINSPRIINRASYGLLIKQWLTV